MKFIYTAVVCLIIGGVVAVGGNAGCVNSNASRCSNGLVCPSGMGCGPAGDRCIDTDLLASCRGEPDGTECTVPGLPPATCLAGVCQASRCGDSRITGAEECDGEQLESKTCQNLGFYSATGLKCGADCKFDTSSCTGKCGDGVKNGPEDCDGADLAGATCFTAGYYAEPGLKCGPDCKFDTTSCSGGKCGDGTVNGLEQCDGKALNGQTCAKLGYFGAMSGLQCSQACTFAAQSCKCSANLRCKPNTERCECPKTGACGCVPK